MDYWTAQANQFKSALQLKTSALMLHFLRTASPGDVARLAGQGLPSDARNRSAAIDVLIGHLVSHEKSQLRIDT